MEAKGGKQSVEMIIGSVITDVIISGCIIFIEHFQSWFFSLGNMIFSSNS